MINRQSRYYPWLLLAVLSVAYLSASVDRIVISLLVDPIKADLGLSDTEISLLLGLAYVLVFSVAGLFMGVLVDRVRRTRLLGLGVGFWNAMTVACGLSNSFIALFLARTGLGIGQAVLTPAGYSLISDAFDKKRLGVALGIFTTGGAIGTGLSLILGGLAIGALSKNGDYYLPVLGALHPWQMIFVIVALPGFVIAAVVAALPEPQRKRQAGNAVEKRTMRAIGQYYRKNARFLACDHIASGLSSFALLGAYSWIAPLLVRLHGWEPSNIGYTVGVVSLIGAPIGLLGGGVLGDYLIDRGPQVRLWICAISAAVAAVFGAIYPMLSSAEHLIISFGIMAMFATVPMGVGIAALQHVLPGEIRGTVSAIFFFSVSAIGMVGPTLIAVISDTFFRDDSGIARATALVVPVSLAIGALLWALSVPPYRRILDNAEGDEANTTNNA